MVFLLKKFLILISSGLMLFSLCIANPLKKLNIDFLMEEKSKQKLVKKNIQKKSSKEKSFAQIIDGFKKIDGTIRKGKHQPGLFTFYWNEEKNKAYISILPSQLEKIYLAGITRQSGDALFLDGSSMLNEYTFMFKKIGDRIQFINTNVRFRADKSSPFHRSVESHKSNSILSSSKIASIPHPESGAILVDISNLFIYDIERISMKSNGLYNFDKKDSYIKYMKSFSKNVEIEMALHFKGKKPVYIYTLPNSSSMISHYHISLSELPNTNYIPREADDRLGHFTTIFQDYSDVLRTSPYTRYINRWHLEKKNPHLKISEPKNQIVYWIENTVPYEYRAAVKEGVEAWNEAFETAGFKNAIVAKQMPDDADWDPADVNYNTIRWILQPGSGYAVGPSRANPYTGQLYDADIRISADFVRSFYGEYTEFILPVINEFNLDLEIEETTTTHLHSDQCKYGDQLREEMASGWDLLTTTGLIKGTDKELKEFIHKGLVDLVLHEVGHTLGLRHNFKGSSIYSIEQLSDPAFTRQYGISGSVMDYQPINIFNGQTFFQTKPGVYDIWAIEYAYKSPRLTGLSEKKMLKNIASRSTDPLLSYGTDEDTYGLSTRGIDPQSNAWDLTNDPINYYKTRFKMSQKLWELIPIYFEKDGEQYSKLRRIFGRGLRQYYSASRNIAKFIGGIYHSRHHVGDPGGKNPFEIVPAYKQREALSFILNNVLAEDSFQFDANLLNKLAPERGWDFKGSVWRMSRIDYPIHDYIGWIQSGALYRLHHPRVFSRIRDNELKFSEGVEKFTLSELFQKVSNSLWTELETNKNINSFRRDLQKSYIEVLTIILLNEKNYFHSDAIALSRSTLRNLYSKIRESLETGFFDDYTRAHLSESANKIQSVYKAQTIIN